MNRKEFFKKLGVGAIAVVVAPKVIAEMPPQKGKGDVISDITVGLFKNGQEIQYLNYHRMNTSWFLEKGTIRPRPVSFPMTPKTRMIEADELRIFNSHDELVASTPIDARVFHGTITIQW